MARTVTPPRPDLIRHPNDGFGWLEGRLLRDGWLLRLGPEAVCVLTLLALAADRNGCSFYGRQRIAEALGIPRHDVEGALARLLRMRLVAHRPWRPGHADGVWQLLPLPPASPEARPRGHLAAPPRRRADAQEPEEDVILVGDALRDLIKSLAAKHGFPLIQHHSPPRAERRKRALPDRQ